MRRIGHLASAVSMGLAGDFPRQVFLAMADTEDQGERDYRRYEAHKRLNDAHRTAGEALW